MAFSETIKVTALPNGVDTGGQTVSLSVLLSPELSGGGGTIQGTDFENWPNKLASYQAGVPGYNPAVWEVKFSDGSGNVFSTRHVNLDASTTNANFWGSLFPPSTSYGPPDPVQDKFRTIPIASYPAKQTTDFVNGQYQNYSPTQPPDFETVKSVYHPVIAGLVGVTHQQTLSKLKGERKARSRGGSVPHANDFTNASVTDSFAAQDYYQTPGAGPPPAAGVGTIDFHRALTFIGQHGVLQRALGLVFDLTISYAGDPALTNLFGSSTVNSDVYVSVALVASPKQNGASPFDFTQLSPRTQCDADSSRFNAHSYSGNIVAPGLLALWQPGKFIPHIQDISGDVIRTGRFAQNIHLHENPGAIKPSYAGNPSSSGKSDFTPPSLRSGGLTLTEVNRGVNLADQLNRAFLLSEAAAAAAASGDSSKMPDLAAEDLVRGYVLDVLDEAAGFWFSTGERNISYMSGSTTLSGPSSPPFDEAAVQAPPRAQTAPDDENADQANLSEIILRYNGWSNAVARPGSPLADRDSALGPGSPPFDLKVTESVPDGTLPPLRFGHNYRLRARVVDVANNRIGKDVTPSSFHLGPVFYGRHEPVPSPDVYPQSIQRLGESLRRLVIRDIDQGTSSVRAMYPQRVSQPFAEAHGLFDDANGDPKPAAYTSFVPRESRAYPDPPTDPATQPPTIPLDQPVPFLPDPLSRGGAMLISTNDQFENDYLTFDFSPPAGQRWPDYRPFGLELKVGSTLAMYVDPARRVVTFTLTPADYVSLELSSTPNASDAAILAMTTKFGDKPLTGDQVAHGTLWAITPAVRLELVYAVQKPLATPEISQPVCYRDDASTVARIDGKLTWSPKSTAKLDVVAAWSDPVDDPVQNELQGPGAPNPALREISNSPVTSLTFTSFFPPNPNELWVTDDVQHEPTLTRDALFDHQLFDTKHHFVTYSAVASSRFAECYPPDTPVSVRSTNPVRVNIPSSARPEPPLITGVTPIFGWGLKSTGSSVVSTREPSALRVFLARPWWSSGIGELLAVIVSNIGFRGEVPAGDLPHVSEWGSDPVFGSPALPTRYPRAEYFPAATHVSEHGLILEEPMTYGVIAAGHDVAFDAARNTWYCDIKVNTGAAYTPMIKLALARYQPDSIQDRELSKVVTTQIMSLEPGRTLTIVRGFGNTIRSVELTGYSYTRAARIRRRAAPGIAEVQVERRVGGIADDTLGWELVGEPIRMRSRPAAGGLTSWFALDVPLKGSEQHRLVVTQYEVLPTDNRADPARPGSPSYKLPAPGREHRLVHQDIVLV